MYLELEGIEVSIINQHGCIFRGDIFSCEGACDPKSKMLSVRLSILSYPSDKTCVLSTQNNRLIETVILSAHNIPLTYVMVEKYEKFKCPLTYLEVRFNFKAQFGTNKFVATSNVYKLRICLIIRKRTICRDF